MVEEFELAMAEYAQVGQQQPVRRERTFFEKPLSTLVMVVFTGAMVFILWHLITTDKPVRGSAFTSLGAYIAYAAAWLAGTKRRNEKDEAAS